LPQKLNCPIVVIPYRKIPHFSSSRLLVRDEREDDWYQDETRNLKHVHQSASADDAHGEKRQQNAAGEPAEFLERLHGADGLLDRRPRQRADFRQPRNDSRRLLNRAEGRRVGGRHHHGRDDGRRAESRLEQLGEAGPLQRAGALLLLPRRRLRKERPHEDQRDRGNDPDISV
jgi:hypothetical protein